MDQLVATEDVRVTITHAGYVKRTSIRSYTASSKDAPGMKAGDTVLQSLVASTTDVLLLFTKKRELLVLTDSSAARYPLERRRSAYR